MKLKNILVCLVALYSLNVQAAPRPQTKKTAATSKRAVPKKAPSKAALKAAAAKRAEAKKAAQKRAAAKRAAAKRVAAKRAVSQRAAKNVAAQTAASKRAASKRAAAQRAAKAATAKRIAAQRAAVKRAAAKRAASPTKPKVVRVVAPPKVVAKPVATVQTVAAQPVAAPKPIAPPKPVPPPTAQAYVAVEPGVQTSYGQTMVPIRFLADALGASVGPIAVAPGENLWRVSYFGHNIDLFPYQNGARFNERAVTLAAQPMMFGDSLYVPWNDLAQFLGVRWKLFKNNANRDVMLLQLPAAYIQSVRHANSGDKVRVVMTLSNATRVVAARKGLDAQFFLAAARRANVPAVEKVNDYLVSRAVTRSGNWQASLAVRLNYQAPVRWFTLGSPPRLVIDFQRLFEESSQSTISGGLSLSKIRRGTAHGPVQMFLVRLDPREGWRVRPEPAGFSTLQRNRVSTIARRTKSLVAINGGFFAYDGAALGAVMKNGEWIRLPWLGRTALGISSNGTARIGNLQTRAVARFGEYDIPVRDLNGWPDGGAVTALTRRFRSYYKLRAGQIALVVQRGIVTAKPGSGGVAIPADGFVLVAGGGAVPILNRIARGQSAVLRVEPLGWPDLEMALGGGPRLVNAGEIQVTGVRESFRSDVRVGLGPRTALGIDRQGRLMLLVVDGRRPFYSTGLTLTELAATMRKFGAVDAMNFDGGGSTAMAIRGKIINRPSDGGERAVANALVVTR